MTHTDIVYSEEAAKRYRLGFALRAVVDALREEGYAEVTVDQLDRMAKECGR